MYCNHPHVGESLCPTDPNYNCSTSPGEHSLLSSAGVCKELIMQGNSSCFELWHSLCKAGKAAGNVNKNGWQVKKGFFFPSANLEVEVFKLLLPLQVVTEVSVLSCTSKLFSFIASWNIPQNYLIFGFCLTFMHIEPTPTLQLFYLN